VIIKGGDIMEYTVQGLAKIAGVSTRTLRYYDEIGLLKPARVNSAGYRIYGRTEVDMLQQILFFRELGLNLKKIKDIITSPSFDRSKALREHHKKLLQKKRQLDLLIHNVERTMESIERRRTMADKDKFEGFKRKLIDDNEKKYGKEIREKYGDSTVDKFHKKLMGMTQQDFEAVQRLGEEIIETLLEAYKTGDPAGQLAQRAADMHRQWLSYYWPKYTKEAHLGVAQLYVQDERFTAYYDQRQPGLAAFLKDAVEVYVNKQK
jgi:DNA-binding transcriptional MerR regulator